MLVRLAKKYRPLHSKNKVENFAIGGRAEGRASPVIHRTPCNASVGDDDPVAVPKIFALPYGGRLKF